MKTLEEKLGAEARTCPTCRYKIANPFTQLCPRCMTAVPVVNPACGDCFHNSACPVSSPAEIQSKRD